MQRYLTVGEKRLRVAEWRASRKRRLPKGDLAGKGYPDPVVFELTDKLNEITGVCTTQSCGGHPRTDEHHWSAPGNLWLRLSETMFTAFLEDVDELVEHPRIEQAGILWGRERDGHVVDIVFEGLNKGEAELAEASEVLIRFFSRLGVMI